MVASLVFFVLREKAGSLNDDGGNGHVSLFLNEAGANPNIKSRRRFGLNKKVLHCTQLLRLLLPSSNRQLRHLQ